MVQTDSVNVQEHSVIAVVSVCSFENRTLVLQSYITSPNDNGTVMDGLWRALKLNQNSEAMKRSKKSDKITKIKHKLIKKHKISR